MGKANTSTVWDVRAGEALAFPTLGVRVELVHKSGQLARLHISAPADAPIGKEKSRNTDPGFDTGMKRLQPS